MESKGGLKLPLGMGALCLIALCVTLGSLAVPRYPWMGDETDFVSAGITAGERGVPIQDAEKKPSPRQGVWHPPLYIYSMGLCTRVLGPSERALRLPGSLGLGLTVLLVGLMARRWYVADSPAAGWALLLLLSAPLVLGSAMLIDIDTSWLPFVILTFLYLLPVASDRVLGAWFGICLLAKMTTTLLLPPAAALHRWFQKGPIAGIRTGIQILAVGLVILLLCWGSASHYIGRDFWEPFRHTFLRSFRLDMQTAADESDTGKRLALKFAHPFWMYKAFVFRATPGLLLLGLRGSLDWWKSALPGGRAAAVVLWGILGTYLPIMSAVAGFPKYLVPSMPLLCLAAAPVAARLTRGQSALRVAGAAVLLAAALFIGWKDPLEVLLPTDRRVGWQVVTAIVGFFGISIVLTLALVRVLLAPRSWRETAGLILIVHTLGWGWLESVQLLNPEKSELYYYGDTDIRRAARHLKEIVQAGQQTVSPREVALLAGLHCDAGRPALFLSKGFAEQIAAPRLCCIVTRVMEYEDFTKFPEVVKIVSRHFQAEALIGRYQFWVRRKSP